MWTLHAREGWNIQLHFLDFDVEGTYDVVEVRDGAGPQSELLGGSDQRIVLSLWINVIYKGTL